MELFILPLKIMGGVICFAMFITMIAVGIYQLLGHKNEKTEYRIIGHLSAILSGLMSFIAIGLAASLSQEVLLKVLSWPWLILPAMVTGPLLYKLRCRFPWVYGAVEVLISWELIALAIGLPAPSAPDNGTTLLAKSTGIITGLYITVRGLDNMNKDVPEVFRRLWDRILNSKRT
jgi:hypothetical protein